MAALEGIRHAVLIAGGLAKGVDLSPLAAAAPGLSGVVAIGQAAPAWLNAANEVAVAAFLGGTLPWLGIAEVVEDALHAYAPVELQNVGDVLEVDRQARQVARIAVQHRSEAA